MRRNMLAKFTVKVAEFLKLPRPETYTDHAIRRSSASIMAASGATTSQLKTHFNWKSEATSLKYIETSDSAKKTSQTCSLTIQAHQATLLKKRRKTIKL